MGTSETDRLLTADDLARRWGCHVDAVWDAVDVGLPFLYLGRGTPAKGRRGMRGLYRFRPPAVEAWESSQQKSFTVRPEDPDAAPIAPLGKPAGWDGQVRGGRKGRAKAPRKA